MGTLEQQQAIECLQTELTTLLRIIRESDGIQVSDDVMIYCADGAENVWYVCRDIGDGYEYLNLASEWEEHVCTDVVPYFATVLAAYAAYDLWQSVEAYAPKEGAE